MFETFFKTFIPIIFFVDQFAVRYAGDAHIDEFKPSYWV